MKLTVLGMSPAFPNPNGASSGYLLESGTTHVLIDCGHGVGGRLEAAIDPRDLRAIVISHMHPDHFFDLVPLTYAFRFVYTNAPPVPLLLPPAGLEVLTGLQSALDLSDSFFAEYFDVREYEPASELPLGDVTVRFAPTQHYIDTYAMRFSADGAGSLIYSADTGWSEEVIELARNASLALVESTSSVYPEEETFHGHLTPELAGRLAREAGVERLVLTHYWMPLGERLRSEAERTFGRPVELAEPGGRLVV